MQRGNHWREKADCWLRVARGLLRLRKTRMFQCRKPEAA